MCMNPCHTTPHALLFNHRAAAFVATAALLLSTTSDHAAAQTVERKTAASAASAAVPLDSANPPMPLDSANPRMPLDSVMGGLLQRQGVESTTHAQRANAHRQRALRSGKTPAQFRAEEARKKPLAAKPVDAQAADVIGLLVRFKSADVRAAAARNEAPPQALVSAVQVAAGVPVEYVRAMSLGFYVFRFPAARSLADADAIKRRIEQLGTVELVDLDIQAKTSLVPNDEFGAKYQYSLAATADFAGGIDAVGAWDLTQGLASTVVAVIDTGITAHPEFDGRVLPGADLISNPAIANDGDGRDTNAADPGDWQPAASATASCPASNSSWHGTHVAGIIAAKGNNGIGIAGVNWNARILPVRVLGRCGGAISDIFDGFLWAIGLPVPGLAGVNANPARVINMSLGGNSPGGCSRVAQLAIQEAKSRGVVIVVAAGNSNEEVTTQVPASCDGVITVGAVDPFGKRASYSNYSFAYKVQLSAPGGDQNRYGIDGGVLSTVNAGTTAPAGPGYARYQGTSMSAPHVAGIASLALAANPNLSGAEIAALLQTTATDFQKDSQCDTYYPLCGEGIANAKAAVIGANALLPFTIVTEFFNKDTGHYFRTGDRDEPAIVESGRLGNWVNTEDYFIAWRDGSQGALPVCRFYSYKFNSHFYTVDANECAAVKRNADWTYESIAFYAKVPVNGVCLSGTKPITRFYNNRQNANDGNHGFTQYGDYYRDVFIADGWTDEGVRMCAASFD
jgi:serine protease